MVGNMDDSPEKVQKRQLSFDDVRKNIKKCKEEVKKRMGDFEMEFKKHKQEEEPDNKTSVADELYQQSGIPYEFWDYDLTGSLLGQLEAKFGEDMQVFMSTRIPKKCAQKMVKEFLEENLARQYSLSKKLRSSYETLMFKPLDDIISELFKRYTLECEVSSRVFWKMCEFKNTTIDIFGIDKVELLRALWENAQSQESFRTSNISPQMFDTERAKTLVCGPISSFDGRVIAADISGNYVNSSGYDRAHGTGEFARVVFGLKR